MAILCEPKTFSVMYPRWPTRAGCANSCTGQPFGIGERIRSCSSMPLIRCGRERKRLPLCAIAAQREGVPPPSPAWAIIQTSAVIVPLSELARNLVADLDRPSGLILVATGCNAAPADQERLIAACLRSAGIMRPIHGARLQFKLQPWPSRAPRKRSDCNWRARK